MTPQVKRVVLIGAAAVLLVCAFVRAWFTFKGDSIGLWGVEICANGCRGVRWDNVPSAQDDLYMAGYIAFAASIIGAALAIAVAIGRKNLIGPARIALGIAIVTMVYFGLRGIALDGLPKGVQISWALILGPMAAIAAHRFVGERQSDEGDDAGGQ